MKKNIMKKAFTLAEILIVLAIIGSIAALTVPSLYARINPGEKQCRLGLQKAIITVDDAIKKIATLDMADNSIANIGSGGYNSTVLTPYLQKYMQVSKICTDSNKSECLRGAPDTYKFTKEDGSTANMTISNPWITSDGMLMYLMLYYKGCLSSMFSLKEFGETTVKTIPRGCANVFVDVNGEKGPNKIGYDRYIFAIGKFGIK